MKRTNQLLLAAVPAILAIATACGKTTTKDVQIPPTTTYVQIERLGRPAVNEGLVYTNDFLNAYNSIPPSADLTAAASPVVAQAAGVITAVYAVAGGHPMSSAGEFVNEVAGEFLPDVMRIDTTQAIPPGTEAYAAAVAGPVGRLTGVGILTGGRKIEDDVMDDTLSVLAGTLPAGVFVQDNVSYKGHAGNPQQGHQMLHGASAYGGTATFPYLAKPN